MSLLRSSNDDSLLAFTILNALDIEFRPEDANFFNDSQLFPSLRQLMSGSNTNTKAISPEFGSSVCFDVKSNDERKSDTDVNIQDINQGKAGASMMSISEVLVPGTQVESNICLCLAW